jgi:Bacteriocin-protection, YdeI or OmpD-Associated
MYLSHLNRSVIADLIWDRHPEHSEGSRGCLYKFWLIHLHFMNKITIEKGTIHELPDDMQEILRTHPDILDIWNNLTPLGRNERICRVTIVKKQVTRENHLERLCIDLKRWKRRPCCWPWCPHHNPESQKWFWKKVSA